MIGADVLVSIVIPCRDYEQYVATAIDSALSQRVDGGVEVIVIDDASRDGSWNVIDAFATGGRIRAVRQTENVGYVKTYRRGMALARGRYVLPLDADDHALVPTAVATQVAIAEPRPEVGLVHSPSLEIDADGRPIGTRRGWGPTGVTPSEEAFRRLLLGNSIQHSGTLIRRSAYEAVGGYDESLFNSIDWDLWLRLARRYAVGHVARPLYAYRVHDTNMHLRHTDTPAKQEAVRAELMAVLDRATADVPPRLRRHAFARAYALMASADLARGSRGRGASELARALRSDLTVIAAPEFRAAALRLVASALLPGRAYRALARSRRTVNARTRSRSRAVRSQEKPSA